MKPTSKATTVEAARSMVTISSGDDRSDSSNVLQKIVCDSNVRLFSVTISTEHVYCPVGTGAKMIGSSMKLVFLVEMTIPLLLMTVAVIRRWSLIVQRISSFTSAIRAMVLASVRSKFTVTWPRTATKRGICEVCLQIHRVKLRKLPTYVQCTVVVTQGSHHGNTIVILIIHWASLLDTSILGYSLLVSNPNSIRPNPQ